jgi:hypothetical protein
MDEELYEVVTGANSCDACAGMAGFHAEDPGVPFHDNCTCQVFPPDENCFEEIRNMQSSSSTYEITVQATSFENCGGPASSIDVAAGGSFDDAFGFDYQGDDSIDCEGDGGGGGGGAGSADIPANSRGSVTMTVEMTSTLCIGERWQVCNAIGPGGTQTVETYIGDVGGYSESGGDVTDTDVDAEPCR